MTPRKPTYEELERQITEIRAQSEEALKEYKTRYGQLFNAAPAGIVEVDFINGKIARVNDIICELTGYSYDELLCLNPADILSDESREMYYFRLEELLKNKKEYDRAEYKFRRKDGREIWGGLFLRYFYENGVPSRATIVAHDITERKTAEIALKESEQKYRLLIENSVQGIIIVQEYRIVFLNNAFAKMSGYSAAELLSMPAEELMAKIHPDDYDIIWKRYKDRLEGKPVPSIYELRLIHKTGGTIWASTSASRIEYMGKPASQATFIDITDRKVSEEALKESEEKYRMLLENAGTPIIYFSPDGHVLLLNNTAAESLGGKINDFIGKSAYDIFPEIADSFMKRLNKIIETGQEKIFEDSITVSGRNQWYASSFHVVKNSDGIITGVQVISHDITERKSTEKALRESEKKFKTIFENANDEIVFTDLDGIIIDVNDKIEDILGYKREEVIGKNYVELGLMKPGDISTANRMLENCISGNPPQVVEFEVTKKDGTPVVVEANSRLIVKDGEIEGVVNIVRDITDRKKTEIALKESEEKFKTIFDNANDGILYMDINGTIIDINFKFQDIFGYTREDVIGRNNTELYDIAETNVKQSLQSMKDGHLVERIELNIIRKDGESAFIETNTKLIQKDGEIVGFLSIIRDITEAKRSEEERKKLESQLEHAQKMEAIGALAGGIAHDFNNILFPIIGFTEIAIERLPEGDEIRVKLEEVIKAATRAKKLVGQILAFGRPNTLNKYPLQLKLIIKEVSKLIRATIPTTIDIRLKLDKPCGPVLADPIQIHQVLMNLCTNAYQAMREKGGMLEISLDEVIIDDSNYSMFPGTVPGPYAKITVKDTGQGIAPAIIKRIFEPYFTTKAIGVGTGLGLSVVHGIVKAHKGICQVSSEFGKGASFNIFFPVMQSDFIEELPRPAETGIPAGRETILLVDDEAQIVYMIQEMLENLGYQVTARSSSVEALEAFKAQPEKYDIVITDQTMPNMTGVELSRNILKIRPDMPIVICTGFSEQIDEYRAKQIGISGYLMKPVTMNEITNTIRRILDQNRHVIQG